MEEEEKKIMYQNIYQQFFMQSDNFLVQKWSRNKISGKSFSEQDRQEAYHHFYQKVKKDKVANRQTIRRWFGLGGSSIPSREQIFQIAFSLGFSVDETEEYLQYGISDAGFQINDYSECIIMFCLDHSLDWDTCQSMIRSFELYGSRKSLRQTSHTDQLKKEYESRLKQMGTEEFLRWMCENSFWFKGYSLTTLRFFQSLIEETLTFFRGEVVETLLRELKETDFYTWAKEHHIREEDYGEAIRRYVKNVQRRKDPDIPEEKLAEIKRLLVMGYSSRNRITDLLTEIYAPMNFKNCGIDPDLCAAMEKEIGTVNAPYLSELLGMSLHKEKMIQLNRAMAELALLPDEEVCPAWIQKLLPQRKNQTSLSPQATCREVRDYLQRQRSLQGQRIRNIKRSDLLILLQYVCQKKYYEELLDENREYSKIEAKEEFVEAANTIMDACGMRRIDPAYRLDYILLSCFEEEEIFLFAEIFEEVL